MIRTLIAVVLAAFVIPAVAAQDAGSPLIIREFESEFLMAYNGSTVEPLSYCLPQDGDTYSGYPIVFSPDATRFAYSASIGTGNLTRIYVCDLVNRALVPLSGQDENLIRLPVAWSPDGSRLAWNQVNENSENLQTIIHDFTSSQIIYERPERSSSFIVPNLDWGAAGLAIYDTLVDSAGQPQASVTFIKADTGESRSVAVGEVANLIGEWAQYEGGEVFVLSATGRDITAVNPQSDQVETLTGRLETYSLTAGQGSIGLTQILPEDEWVVFGPDFNGGLGISGSPYSVTISPDGQKLALVTFENYPWGGKAYILDSFAGYPYPATPVPGMNAAGYSQPGAMYVFWGPAGLRIVQ